MKAVDFDEDESNNEVQKTNLSPEADQANESPRSLMEATQVEQGKDEDPPFAVIDPLLCDPNKIVGGYGFWGPYQWWTAAQCCFVMIFYSGNMHLLPFITEVSTVTCKFSNNSIYNLTNCKYAMSNGDTKTCGAYENTSVLAYSSPQPISSLMHDFDMGCVGEFIRESGQTAFTIGAMLLVPLFSYLADHYGRKLIFLVTVFGSIIANFACGAAPAFWCFVVLRFVVGGLSDSYYTIGANYVCELLSEEQRSFAGLVATVFWALGILYVGALTKVETNWRMLYTWMTLPSVLCLLMIFTLPESPHWAIRQHKRARISAYIKAANRCNRKRLDLDECIGDDLNEKRPKVNSFMTMLGMFKSCIMWKIISIAGLMSFMMNFTYFAISLEAIDLSDDHFTAYMLNGIADLPGAAATIPLLHYFGRKWVAIGSGIACGVSLAAAPFAYEFFNLYWLKVGLILLAKFFNTIVQTLIPVWFPEMLPTSVRVIGFSIINFPQCVGQFIAPFFRHVHFHWAPTKYLTVGIACIICSLFCIFLSDTRGKNMPADLHEVTEPVLDITQSDDEEGKNG